MDQQIRNTRHTAVHPWPEDVFLQGGDLGVVFSPDREPYNTAFVEAFPGDTFIRGEGATVAEAEDNAWKKFLVWRDCDGSGQPHGPYERRSYRNGSGFCTRCGTWASKVFPELPEDPDRPKNLLEQALTGDTAALTTIVDAVADAQNLPRKDSRE